MDKEIKNHIKIITLLIIVFIILYFLHIKFGDIFEYKFEHTEFNSEPTIIFQEDHINNTLTVTEIYPQDRDWHWPEVSIVNGSATLPYGKIEVGNTASFGYFGKDITSQIYSMDKSALEDLKNSFEFLRVLTKPLDISKTLLL